jgi:hypothetical protein
MPGTTAMTTLWVGLVEELFRARRPSEPDGQVPDLDDLDAVEREREHARSDLDRFAR